MAKAIDFPHNQHVRIRDFIEFPAVVDGEDTACYITIECVDLYFRKAQYWHEREIVAYYRDCCIGAVEWLYYAY